MIWNQGPEKQFFVNIPMAWIGTHVVVSLATYGLLTLAALAGFAAMLQERAIKNKIRTRLTRQLPSVVSSEKILVNLLSDPNQINFVSITLESSGKVREF